MKTLLQMLFMIGITVQSTLHAQISYFGNGSVESLKLQMGNYELLALPTGQKQLKMTDANALLQKGSPEVLYQTTTMIVDDSREMEIMVSHATFHDIANVQLIPSKGNLSRQQDPNSIPFEWNDVYSQDAFFPGNLAKLGSPFVQNQFRAQAVHFFPFQYNPVTQVLRVYDEIEIVVQPTDQIGSNPLINSQTQTNALRKEMYAHQFINYSAHQDRYSTINEIGNMLVITHGSYMDELAPWVQWKKEKGIDVRVIDVASVPTVAAMNAYIQAMYNDASTDLTYLTLVGDEDQVPSELVTNPSGTGYCDNCFGYISGNDHYAEIFIGRLLVHNEAELVPVLAKIMEYEKYPYLDNPDWFSTAMGIGSDEGAGIGDDNEADWQHQNNIKSDLLSFTYDNVFERYDGNHTASSPTGGTTADAAGAPAASTLSNVINGGCSLINYTGHGDHSLIVTGSYTNAQINQLTNYHMYPYFIIVGCCVGDFDDDSGSGDTFGEAWLKSPIASTPTGGIGGAFSTVFQSWAPPMEGQDEMNKIIADLSTNLGAHRHTFGSIHIHGCAGMNDVYGVDGADMTDTWILMGDPTIQLRTDFPTPIAAQHPVSIMIGMTTMNVTSTSENAIACLTWNGVIIATAVITGGQANLYFDALNQPGTLLLTLTNFNTTPYQQSIDVIPAEGPYVVSNQHTNQDNNGINTQNNAVDYGEQIIVDLNLENVGISSSGNLTLSAEANNSGITWIDNSAAQSAINAGQSIIINDAFAYNVDAAIADGTVVTFTITITDDLGNSWTTTYNETIYAPDFACGEVVINDNQGNGDGLLQTGEFITIEYHIINQGHAASELADVTAVSSSNLSLTNGNLNLGTIAANGGDNFVSLSFTVDGTANTAENASIDINVVAGAYTVNCQKTMTINQIIETWESGNDDSFPWQYEGNQNWFVSTELPFEGNYCMESGDINNSQVTTLKLVTNFSQAGDVSFMYKTSTEGSYDFLTFNVNNTNINSWSGENDWSNYSHPVNAGNYTLRWKYTKDNVVSNGSDACWVDNIVLPPSTNTFVFEEETNGDVQLYPNPTDGSCSVQYIGSYHHLVVFDANGKMVENLKLLNHPDKVSQSVMINTQSWTSGKYHLQLQGPNTSKTIFLIKK